MVKLACLLSQSNEIVKVENPEKEKYVTVLLYGRGVIERTIKDGKTPVSFTGYRVHAGQLIVSTINARHGAIGIIPRELEGAVVSKDFPVFNIDETKINKDYLLYTLLSDDFVRMAEANSFGATMPRLHAKQLLEMEINLAPIEEQVTIVKKLQEAEKLLHLQKQQLAKLDELVKSQFVEMFGTFPANEHSWPVGTIRDGVMDVRYGSCRKAAEGNNGQYPYLRMNNITYSGELDLSDVKTIDIPDDELDKCSVRRGDVLFNRTNSRELVGKTCVYNRDELMVLAGFVVRVRVNDRLLPEFLSAFMNTDFTKTLLLSMCKAAIGQANINATEFQNIGIYFPPIEHQQEFVQMKAQADKSKLAVKQSLEKLETLKKSLMQQYFG